MNGLNEIYANDRKEVLIAYHQAVNERDLPRMKKLRAAHHDLVAKFDQIDIQRRLK